MINTPTHRLSLTLITALLGALLLAMFASTASAQSGSVIGRGFVGVVISVNSGTGLMTVDSNGAFFQLIISDGTVINNPPELDVGLAGLPTETGFKIAGLASREITDEKGNVTLETLIAQKITVIPKKATRSHKWTIAVDKQGEDLTTLDEDGSRTDLPGWGNGFEIGDKIILLLQASSRDGIGETVRGLFKAGIADERLERLAQAAADDPLKAAALDDLRNSQQTAHEQRLQRTAENAGPDFQEFVLNQVKALQGTTGTEGTSERTGQTVSGCAKTIADSGTTAECPETTETVVDTSPVIRLTSPSSGTVVSANDVVTVTAETGAGSDVVSVTFNVAGSDQAPLAEGPYTVDVTIPTGVSSVEIKVTAADAAGKTATDSINLRVARAIDVGVKIVSPLATSTGSATSRVSTVSGSNEALAEGDTISILAEATGMGTITVVFKVNGVVYPSQTAPPYSLSYFLPLTPTAEGPPPLKITATATDGSGNTASDSVEFTVVRRTNAVNVTITNPLANAKLNAGDTIVIGATTDNDAQIAFVTFSVGGTETVVITAPYIHTYVLPSKASTTAAGSTVPPHVFVGKATLNGAPVPDETIVIAWIDGTNAATLTIDVTATANSGTTGSASLSLKVSGLINAGEAIVTNGVYVLNAAQPSGQNFNGKTVFFTVGGKDASQTATWQKGDADVLNLTAN